MLCSPTRALTSLCGIILVFVFATSSGAEQDKPQSGTLTIAGISLGSAMSAVPARLHALHHGTIQRELFPDGPMSVHDVMFIDDAPFRMDVNGQSGTNAYTLQTPARRIGVVGTYIDKPTTNEKGSPDRFRVRSDLSSMNKVAAIDRFIQFDPYPTYGAVIAKLRAQYGAFEKPDVPDSMDQTLIIHGSASDLASSDGIKRCVKFLDSMIAWNNFAEDRTVGSLRCGRFVAARFWTTTTDNVLVVTEMELEMGDFDALKHSYGVILSDVKSTMKLATEKRKKVVPSSF